MDRGLAVSGALLALAFPLTLATPARATPSSRLTYVRGPGAETCPGEAELRRAVAERLGYDPFFPSANRTIVAQIERKGGGYAAELKILDASGISLGERSLPPTTRDCSEVLRSLALAISIAIDDLDAAAPKPPVDAPVAAPEPPPAPTPAPAPPPVAPADAPAAASPEKRPVWLAAEVSVLGAVASAPAPALGGAAGARLVGPWWSVGLEGRLDAPASDAIPGGGRVETALTLGVASACAWIGDGWRPFVCAVGALGSFRGTTTDVTTARSATALYSGFGARLGLDVSLAGPLYASGRLGALGSFTPHRALLNGAVVFTLPSVSGEVAVGLGVRFL